MRAEVVGEGCGLEIVLWRGPARYPAGVCIRVHLSVYACVRMGDCVYV